VDVKVMPGRKSVRTDAAGRFKVPLVRELWQKDQSFCLVARQADRGLAAAVEIRDDARSLDVKLTPGVTVTGQVTDPDGKPIRGANVRILLRVSNTVSPIETVITNEKGSYEIRALPPGGTYNLDISATGFGRASPAVNIDDAKDNELTMDPVVLKVADRSISGLVVDANDEPAAGVGVNVSGHGQPYRVGRTGKDGRFTIDHICEGRVSMYAHTGGGRSVAYGQAEAEAGDKNVKIVLRVQQTTTAVPAPPTPTGPVSLLGKPLPKLADLNVALDADKTRGRRLLVCFWNWEQRPSRHCIRQLVSRADELARKGVVVVCIHAAAIDEKTLRDWLTRNKIPFPAGSVPSKGDAGAERKDLARWGVRGVPWLILTDEKHVVRAEGISLDRLDAKLAGSTPK